LKESHQSCLNWFFIGVFFLDVNPHPPLATCFLGYSLYSTP